MFKNTKKLKTLSIPSSITSINNSFLKANSLKSLDFNGRLDSISNSFLDLYDIERIEFKGNCKEISHSFSNCKKLSILNLPNGVEAIIGSFNNAALTALRLPPSLKRIQNSFKSLSKLKELTLEKNFTAIDQLGFISNCKLDKIYVNSPEPSPCQEFRNWIRNNGNITIVVPKGKKKVYMEAWNLQNISSLTIEDIL